MFAIVLKNKGTLKEYIQENSAISAAQEKLSQTSAYSVPWYLP